MEPKLAELVATATMPIDDVPLLMAEAMPSAPIAALHEMMLDEPPPDVETIKLVSCATVDATAAFAAVWYKFMAVPPVVSS